MRRLVETAVSRGKPVTMCGELAGDPLLTPLMLALGVRRISVSRSHVNRLAAALCGLSVADVAPIGRAVLACSTGKEVREVLRAHGMPVSS